MKYILSTLLLLTIINFYGQTPDPCATNTDFAIKIVKDNLSKKDSTFNVLFVNGSTINSKVIKDSLYRFFPIIITEKDQADSKHFKGEMNCFNVRVYGIDNAYIEFLTLMYQEDSPGTLIFVPANKNYKMEQYNYLLDDKKLVKIKY